MRHTAYSGYVLNRYTAFLFAAYLYSLLIESGGGLKGGLEFACQYLEIPIILYVYWYLNLILRPGRWTAVLAAMPILLAYIGQDIYYLLLGKVFRIAELAEVGELLQVMSLKYSLLVIGSGTALLVGILSRFNMRQIPLAILGLIPLSALLLWVELVPQQFVREFTMISQTIVNWSDALPVEANGRFTMLLYREAQRRIALEITASSHNRTAYDEDARKQAAWLSQNGSKRNVHIIVMESLLDPSLFSQAKFSADPVNAKYRALIGNHASFSISPIFGGNTSQAEFEVLCGVPAFQELGGVEFNSFSGSAAHCLPDILAQTGYRTTASNAYDPTFFNAVNAYRGIGFRDAFFPREFSPDPSTYLSTGDTTGEIYMFDSVLFSENIHFVREHLRRNHAQPLLNYVLTMYGHSPHVLNAKKRPRLIRLTSELHDPQLERVANQFFYRSEAIADYLEALLSIDPQSLIIIVSDHLPPLEGKKTYKSFGYLNNEPGSFYLNRLIVVKNGSVTAFPTIHHFDIPKVVLNYLSYGRYCEKFSCSFTENNGTTENPQQLHEQYLRLMSHAIEN